MFGILAGLFRRRTDAEKLNAEVNNEIHGRLFPHLRDEKDHGYPFASKDDLLAHTESLDVHEALEKAERQIAELPEAYGQCFRYAMRRDLCERLRLYTALARQNWEPNVYWRPEPATAKT